MAPKADSPIPASKATYIPIEVVYLGRLPEKLGRKPIVVGERGVLGDMYNTTNGSGRRIKAYTFNAYPDLLGRFVELEEDAMVKRINVTKRDFPAPTVYVNNAPKQYSSIGTDPEIFVVNKEGTIIPAFLFLTDKKKAGNHPYWDGFQAEFNPGVSDNKKYGHTCLAYMTDDIQFKLRELIVLARRFDKEARLTHESVIEIPEGIMKEAKEDHVALGCAPSLNAYGLPPLDIPEPRRLPIRFAGYHVHLGFKQNEMGLRLYKQIVKGMDATIGVISVALFQGLEDYRRRQFYGRAGEFRLPKHGLEYRVLSSAVLVSPIIHHLVFEFARAFASLCTLHPANLFWKGTEKSIISTINEYDVKKAKEIIKKNEPTIRALLNRAVTAKNKDKRIEFLMSMIYDGAKKYLSLDIEDNWKLNHVATCDPGRWITHSATKNCCIANMKIKKR